MEEKSFLKKAFTAIDWILATVMVLCGILAIITTAAGLILNYGFIGSSVIVLVTLGVILAVMWTISFVARELTGSNRN
jgi:hypothetical protein